MARQCGSRSKFPTGRSRIQTHYTDSEQIPKRDGIYSDLVLLAFATKRVSRETPSYQYWGCRQFLFFECQNKNRAKKSQLERSKAMFENPDLVPKLTNCEVLDRVRTFQETYKTMLILASHAFNEKPKHCNAVLVRSLQRYQLGRSSTTGTSPLLLAQSNLTTEWHWKPRRFCFYFVLFAIVVRVFVLDDVNRLKARKKPISHFPSSICTVR